MIHNNEVISIEEDLLNCRQLIRRFTFNNRNNGLKIGVLTIGAQLVSCELSSHQIIVQNNANQESAPQVRANWISHVRGPDTLCLSSGVSSSQSQSLVYQLTPQNELIVIGRFRSQQHLFSQYFFNLVTDQSLDFISLTCYFWIRTVRPVRHQCLDICFGCGLLTRVQRSDSRSIGIV